LDKSWLKIQLLGFDDPDHDMSGEGCEVNVIYRVKQALQNSPPQQRWPESNGHFQIHPEHGLNNMDSTA